MNNASLAPFLLLVCAFLGSLLLVSLVNWRIWAAAIVVALAASILVAVFDPINIELGIALAAFLPALAGAALGSRIRRKRTV